MERLFAKRMEKVHRSFIREILKVTDNPEIISFAGGLPNPRYFPVKPVAAAAAVVFEEHGQNAMQYSTTEGYRPLREYIARRYWSRFKLKVEPDEIMITNGSQQGLDLLGKIFLDQGDRVLLERPAYLGAIQALGLFGPEFRTVLLQEDGADLEQLHSGLRAEPVKLFYTVPNFQNPSGISYSAAKRPAVAEILQSFNTILIEDDPYSELKFSGESVAPISSFCEQNAVLLGSFSKIVGPGLRMGWICAPSEVMEKLVVAKQGADLHSNYLTQLILHQYLQDNDLDGHIATIKQAYQRQRDLMVQLLEDYCPPEVTFTRPEGGMFLWLTLPEGVAALDLFEAALKEKVAFVPGNAFFVDGGGANTLRLNFSNSDEAQIETGIERLGRVLERFLVKRERQWEGWVGR